MIIYALEDGYYSCLMIFVIAIGVLLLFYHYVFLLLSFKRLARYDFNPSSVPEENDKVVLELAFSYFIPLLEWLIDDKLVAIPKLLVPIATCLIVLIILCNINNTAPSPLYLIIGYHFHTVESDGKTYTIISRRRHYRNTKNISGVKKIFDDMFIVVK
jgi:hypothetical protein